MSRSKMLIIAALAAAVAALMVFPVGPTTPAQAAVTTNVSVPVDMSVFVPCANGGAGEVVHLTGDLHTLLTFTDDGAGGFHTSSHFQPQGISGVGLDTGDKYVGTGVTRSSFDIKPPFPSESTSVNNFRIIGQGSGNNLLIHENFHVTVDANGAVTATVDNLSAECK